MAEYTRPGLVSNGHQRRVRHERLDQSDCVHRFIGNAGGSKDYDNVSVSCSIETRGESLVLECRVDLGVSASVKLLHLVAFLVALG